MAEQIESDILVGEKCHARRNENGYTVFVHLDKQHGVAQEVALGVSYEVAKEMMKEIDAS